MAKIKITLVKSKFGRIKVQSATLEALGLKKIGGSVVHENNVAIQGMINKVSHLVKVEEI